MNIASKVSPIKGKHSIKEVVLSLFLVESIVDPAEYSKALSHDFGERFDKYDPVSNFQVQFRKENNNVQTQFNLRENAGFKFVKIKDGSPVLILQGINEPRRSFISFHSLDYTRWSSFFNDFKKDMKVISQYRGDIAIRGFSLHYIDELLWIGEGPIDKSLILKDNKEKIPGDFFTTTSPTYSLISEKLIGSSVYFDRLEIKVHNTENPALTISHNITENLEDSILFRDLFDSDFEQKIEEMHSYNKELLADILQDVIQVLIGLKNQKNDEYRNA